jgi:hypothetical protein
MAAFSVSLWPLWLYRSDPDLPEAVRLPEMPDGILIQFL